MTPIRPDEALLDGPRASRVFFAWITQATRILTGQQPVQVPRRTVAQLEQLTAADNVGRVAICTNDAGGEILCWCDGTVWRRSSDRAEITA